MGLFMGDERVTNAIGRIDRALARIESAASRPFEAPGGAQSPSGDDSRAEALEEANRTLRSKVEGAIAQIDRLLERG
jgi:hypothetical protein